MNAHRGLSLGNVGNRGTAYEPFRYANARGMMVELDGWTFSSALGVEIWSSTSCCRRKEIGRNAPRLTPHLITSLHLSL